MGLLRSLKCGTDFSLCEQISKLIVLIGIIGHISFVSWSFDQIHKTCLDDDSLPRLKPSINNP